MKTESNINQLLIFTASACIGSLIVLGLGWSVRCRRQRRIKRAVLSRFSALREAHRIFHAGTLAGLEASSLLLSEKIQAMELLNPLLTRAASSPAASVAPKSPGHSSADSTTSAADLQARAGREIAAKALNVLAHINRGQAERSAHPIMRIYHMESAADYAAAAERLSASTIHNPQSTIPPV